MEVIIGKEGLKESWQQVFEETTKCVYCGSESRIGFVAHETRPFKGPFVFNLHENKKESKWLHDCCYVAVYFCTDCLSPTAKYNQA